MKILIVHPRLDFHGGAELVVEKLARYLMAHGMECAILTTTLADEMKPAFKGIRVIVKRRSLPLMKGGFSEIISLWQETRRIEKEYDLLNVHNFPAELAAFHSRRPVLWMCNEPPLVHLAPGPAMTSLAEIKKRILLAADRMVVKSSIRHVAVADEFNAKRFKTLYGIQPRIIHYGIDHHFFSSGSSEKVIDDYKLRDAFIILHVGMLTPLKNQMESLRTLLMLRDTIPSAKLILAGSGKDHYKKELETFIQQHALEDRIIMTGHVTREKVRDLYHACNVLLHPIKSQGGWLSPFEALCSGTPVVVSREMTACDILDREHIGIVTDDFVSAIRAVHDRAEECLEMARRGAAWIHEFLSWEAFGDHMVKFFEDICTSDVKP